MSANKCDSCGGKFGLVKHWHFGKQFCSKNCKWEYALGKQREKPPDPNPKPPPKPP